MSYFLTTDDVRRGRKVLYRGRIVTAIDLSGSQVKIAEDGQWYPHQHLNPLTEEQIRDETIHAMSKLVEGKQIVTLIPKGKGVQFVMDDNTRVGLDYASDGTLKLTVVGSDGEGLL